jgi:hypothetical protein
MEVFSSMRFKKLSAILLSAIFILSITGCNGNGTTDSNTGATEQIQNTPETQETPQETQEDIEEGFSVGDRFDLAVPPDAELGKGTLWSWVSDTTDGINNDIHYSVFQTARYLIIEFAGEIDLEARAGLAWQSSYDWGWHEDQRGIELERYLVDDGLLVLPLYGAMHDYASFSWGELEEPKRIKIYFRYGNEREEAEENYMHTLDITEVYFASSVTGI